MNLRNMTTTQIRFYSRDHLIEKVISICLDKCLYHKTFGFEDLAYIASAPKIDK